MLLSWEAVQYSLPPGYILTIVWAYTPEWYNVI